VFERNCAYQLESRGGVGFKPTYLVRTVASPYAFPVIFGTQLHLLTPQPANWFNGSGKRPFNQGHTVPRDIRLIQGSILITPGVGLNVSHDGPDDRCCGSVNLPFRVMRDRPPRDQND
jgi:hypothetical protein